MQISGSPQCEADKECNYNIKTPKPIYFSFETTNPVEVQKRLKDIDTKPQVLIKYHPN